MTFLAVVSHITTSFIQCSFKIQPQKITLSRPLVLWITRGSPPPSDAIAYHHWSPNISLYRKSHIYIKINAVLSKNIWGKSNHLEQVTTTKLNKDVNMQVK